MNGFEPVHERIHAWTDAGQWDDRGYIVRCRDCEYYQRDQCCELFVLADDRLSHIDDPDGFCAWACRREQ